MNAAEQAAFFMSERGENMIHQYKLGGYNIVLDVCSGAVHAVDEVAYDIIALYPDKTADEIVAELSVKYADREDVTEQDLRDLLARYTERGQTERFLDRVCETECGSP